MSLKNIVLLSLVLACTYPAGATTFTANAGTRSAAVDFWVVGDQLMIRLSNLSPSDSLVPTDILTAVFWDLSGNPMMLRPSSAVVDDGSCILYNPTSQCDPASGGSNVGGEWAYRAAANGLSGVSQHYGISSAGLGIFGPGDLFGGPNLSGPVDPDGVQFGLTSKGDVAGTGNGGIQDPLIRDAVVFALNIISPGFTLDAIGNVSFQYGTQLTEPSLPGSNTLSEVPEPGTLPLLGGAALVGIVWALRRRRK